MTTNPISIQPKLESAFVLLVLLMGSANAQNTSSCGALPDVLKFGADQTEILKTREEARRAYRYACNEKSGTTTESAGASANIGWDLFSVGAQNNSQSLSDYRSLYCSQDEDDVANQVAKNFRQRSVNPAAVAAWRDCINQRTGINLDPRIDTSQKVVSFSITYNPARIPGGIRPILRGISSQTFDCKTAGTGERIDVGGESRRISANDALNIRCDRNPETSTTGNRQVDRYREDTLILDLSSGAHRINFSEWREGPILDEFAELQRRIETLSRELETHKQEVHVQVGVVSLPHDSDGLREVVRTQGRRRDQGIVNGRVDFATPFSSVPEVQLALSRLDVWSHANTRIETIVKSVDQEGFDYELYYWADTRVHSATASWIAVAK